MDVAPAHRRAAELQSSTRPGRWSEGQWYWDYVAADNAMGFHNPQESLDTLARAIDLAGRARLAVKDALLP